jgi:hypothetical protein
MKALHAKMNYVIYYARHLANKKYSAEAFGWGVRLMGDQNKVTSLAKRRKRKRKPHHSWIGTVQVVGLILALVLIVQGAVSLIRLNTSYVENTLIPSQKMNAIALPEAKAFALAFTENWMKASAMDVKIGRNIAPSLKKEDIAWIKAEQVERVQVKEVVFQSQYKGIMLLEASAVVAGIRKRFVIRLPMQYIPEQKSYQIYAYPEIKEMNQ